MVYDMKDQFGHYLEDYKVGDIYKHWPGKTITESDNNLFSLLVMNHHPVHLDQEYCAQAIANLDYEKVSHDGPCFIGDTIHAETEILEVRESRSKPDRGIIYVETRAYNQRNEKIMTLRRHVLIPKRCYDEK